MQETNRLIARVFEDAEFRRSLLADPGAAAMAIGVRLPEHDLRHLRAAVERLRARQPYQSPTSLAEDQCVDYW